METHLAVYMVDMGEKEAMRELYTYLIQKQWGFEYFPKSARKPIKLLNFH